MISRGTPCGAGDSREVRELIVVTWARVIEGTRSDRESASLERMAMNLVLSPAPEVSGKTAEYLRRPRESERKRPRLARLRAAYCDA